MVGIPLMPVIHDWWPFINLTCVRWGSRPSCAGRMNWQKMRVKMLDGWWGQRGQLSPPVWPSVQSVINHPVSLDMASRCCCTQSLCVAMWVLLSSVWMCLCVGLFGCAFYFCRQACASLNMGVFVPPGGFVRVYRKKKDADSVCVCVCWHLWHILFVYHCAGSSCGQSLWQPGIADGVN